MYSIVFSGMQISYFLIPYNRLEAIVNKKNKK